MPSKDAENNPVEQPDGSPQEPSGTAAAAGFAPIVYVRAHPRIAIAVSAVFLAAIGAVTGWLLLRPSPLQVASRLAGAALAALDEGDLEGAKKLAQDVGRQTELAEPLATADFVLGAVGVIEAEKAAPAAKGAMFLAAARFFENALSHGLPEDRSGEAKWLLGRSLFEAGQMEAGRAALAEALESQPQRQAHIRRLLTAAFRRDDPPKLAEALEQNKAYLAIEDLTSSERHEGLVQQAEILVAMDKPAECLSVLAKIGPDAKYFPAVNVVEGRALLAEARGLKAKATSEASRQEATKRFQAALAALRKARETETAYTQNGRQALYLLGVCLMELGDAQGALEQFRELNVVEPTEPEYFAAAFQEAGLLRSMGRAPDAAKAYCRALDAVRNAPAFRNPWLSAEQACKGVVDAYQQAMESRNFAAAVELASRPGVVVPIDRSLQMRAEACHAWGRDLLTQAETAEAAKAPALVRDGRMQLRRSSQFWHQLANHRIATRQYPDDLWESAIAALEGRDYGVAASLLKEYLKQDPRGRQPKALAALGEALLSLDSTDEAIEVLKKCIERYPRDVAALRARLLASQALLEKGDLHSAQRMLEENLSGESLTPASREYRESLLGLSRLLHRTKRYDEAIGRLEEAVNRYAGLRQSVAARYLMAECYRQKALGEREKLASDLVEQSRGARVQRIRSALSSSLEWYRQAQQTLLKWQETSPLDSVERLMLRNTYHFIGSVLFDLGQFDAAAQAYAKAVSRYPNTPETLEAHVQMARAFRALKKPEEARGTIEQAKHLLARMKPETKLQDTTNYDKAGWTALLDKLSAM